jgi:hypothetical protein
MSDDDIARHKRPPRKGRFQPGRSGNPKGRPKGSRNIRTHVIELLDAKIPVIEGGRSKNIPRAKAIAIQLVNLAAKGDPKGLAAILTLTRESDEATGQARASPLMQIEDEEVIKDIIERIRAVDLPPSVDPGSDSSIDDSGEMGSDPDGGSSEREPA